MTPDMLMVLMLLFEKSGEDESDVDDSDCKHADAEDVGNCGCGAGRLDHDSAGDGNDDEDDKGEVDNDSKAGDCDGRDGDDDHGEHVPCSLLFAVLADDHERAFLHAPSAFLSQVNYRSVPK